MPKQTCATSPTGAMAGAVKPSRAETPPNALKKAASPRRFAPRDDGRRRLRSTLLRDRWTATLARALFAAALFMAPAAGRAEDSAPAATPLDQLMSVVPIPDIVQGSPEAPATIIEYASMTCTHCAAFHEETWPALKAKYIDSGRAKFILREFPLDPRAAAAFMLARCAGPDKRNALIDALFSQQKAWAFVDEPVAPLLEIVKQNGMSGDEFDACLKNQDLYDKINASRDKAAEVFAIDSTPTFFVDGHKLVGALALADFDRLLEPAAK